MFLEKLDRHNDKCISQISKNLSNKNELKKLLYLDNKIKSLHIISEWICETVREEAKDTFGSDTLKDK